MPPKPCPRRLELLIATDPDALRPILRALQIRRQNKGPETFAVESPSRVTINLDDYSVTVRSELAVALSEIDPPDKIDLIRECRVCAEVFWAGRNDKVVCDKHAGQWRKKNQRDRQKRDQARAETDAEESRIMNELARMRPTAVAVLNAIVFAKQRVFYKIDYEAWLELDENELIRRVPNRYIVRQTLTMLVNRGYLTHEPQDDPLDDYYLPRRKLIDRWRATH